MSTPHITTKIEVGNPTLRLAVLIDADNAQASIIENLLLEIASLGEATVKRIYGDFTSPASFSWKQTLQKYAIKPVQQFAYTKGKNASDCSLIIDAMDLLYTQKFDGFCLVSSDSDFTGLATRLREGGLKVYGFGEEKTPEAFRSACNKFIFTEVLRSPKEQSAAIEKHQKKTVDIASAATNGSNLPEDVKDLLLVAYEQSENESGWAHLGTFGQYLSNVKADFDSRKYGYRKLSDLVKGENGLFEIEERRPENSEHKVIYLRPCPK
jgi:uncharacterized LabA/DUF88 family protein